MILLTFPSIAPGETAIRAQDTGLDASVGYCPGHPPKEG